MGLLAARLQPSTPRIIKTARGQKYLWKSPPRFANLACEMTVRVATAKKRALADIAVVCCFPLHRPATSLM